MYLVLFWRGDLSAVGLLIMHSRAAIFSQNALKSKNKQFYGCIQSVLDDAALHLSAFNILSKLAAISQKGGCRQTVVSFYLGPFFFFFSMNRPQPCVQVFHFIVWLQNVCWMHNGDFFSSWAQPLSVSQFLFLPAAQSTFFSSFRDKYFSHFIGSGLNLLAVIGAICPQTLVAKKRS